MLALLEMLDNMYKCIWINIPQSYGDTLPPYCENHYSDNRNKFIKSLFFLKLLQIDLQSQFIVR